MPRPSVIPEVRVRLEAYLNDREEAYLVQPDETRKPTLPATPDGKVNVRAVVLLVSDDGVPAAINGVARYSSDR